MEHFLPRRWAIPIALLVFCLAASSDAAAQSGYGTLTGTIVDDQLGAVPGALVTITEQATDAVRTATSDKDGAFRLARFVAWAATTSMSRSPASRRSR